MNTITAQFMSLVKNTLVYKQATIPVLGRWNIEKCSTKLDIKIKLANEDHCGSCSNHTLFSQKNIYSDLPKIN